MRLELNNILKVKKADIKLGGLTVLTGVNDSGKSTVGKVLFTILKAANNARLRDKDNTIISIENKLSFISKQFHLINHNISFLNNPNTLSREMVDGSVPVEETFNMILSEIENCNFSSRISSIMKENLSDIQQELQELDNLGLLVSKEFDKIAQSVFREQLNSNVAESSSIVFQDDTTIEGSSIRIGLGKNKLSETHISGHFSIEDITYVESPIYLHLLNYLRTPLLYPLERNRIHIIPYYLSDITEKVLNDASYQGSLFELNNGNEALIKEIRIIIDGDFSVDRKSRQVYFKRKGKSIPIISVAAGIKSFGLLLSLLRTYSISTSRMLVLDEPEIHLHPEWQVNFCKLIVEMVAAGIPIVVSSHSPYFIQGLRYFAAAKGIEKDVVYYMAEPDADSGLSTFEEVTDDLNRVFSLLAAPLNEIMNVDAIRNRE